jgi:hypothetical protein
MTVALAIADFQCVSKGGILAFAQRRSRPHPSTHAALAFPLPSRPSESQSDATRSFLDSSLLLQTPPEPVRLVSGLDDMRLIRHPRIRPLLQQLVVNKTTLTSELPISTSSQSLAAAQRIRDPGQPAAGQSWRACLPASRAAVSMPPKIDRSLPASVLAPAIVLTF